MYPSPWRQQTRLGADGEVTQIMSKTDPDGSHMTRTKVVRDLKSPRGSGIPMSPGNISSPGEAITKIKGEFCRRMHNI